MAKQLHSDEINPAKTTTDSFIYYSWLRKAYALLESLPKFTEILFT
jgi:hypothetical protein